jgi:glycosyltransferase involved in cell wall biosynthesis
MPKLKVALDVSSTKSGHKFRGIGFYTTRLAEHLEKLAKDEAEFDLELFTQDQELPPADLYHYPAFSPFFFSIPFMMLAHSVVTIHDLIPLQFPKHFPPGLKGKLRWKAQKFLLKFVRHVITDSRASRDVIVKEVGLAPTAITPIYLAADEIFTTNPSEQNKSEIRDKYNLPDNFVLYVGDINWHKNVMNLARICVKLKIPLVVVGKQAVNPEVDIMHPWNLDLAQFQAFAKEYNSLIIRLGFVPSEDLVAIYNLATLMAMPSYAEGFGLPILEAMQCGLPVITSKTSSMQEIANQAAILVDPHKNSSLEGALKLLWSDKNMRDALSKAGIERAKTFTWEKTARQTLEVYKTSLSISYLKSE